MEINTLFGASLIVGAGGPWTVIDTATDASTTNAGDERSAPRSAVRSSPCISRPGRALRPG